jgi:hypothetical protein
MGNTIDLLTIFYYTPFAVFSLLILLLGVFLFYMHKHISHKTSSSKGYFIGQLESKNTNNNGRMYSSVYKFTADDGIERICRSGVASSAVTLQRIGTPQHIRYFPTNPNQAKVNNNSYFYLGCACFILGFIFAAVYFANVEFGFIPFLFISGFIFYFAVRIFKRFEGHNLQEKIEFYEKNKNVFKTLEANTKPIQETETFLTNDSFIQIQSKHIQILKKALPVHFILVFGLIFGGLYWAYSTSEFERQAHKTIGTITSMKKSTSHTEGRVSYTYAPVVSYNIDGKKYTHTSKVSSSNPTHKTGETLTVLYDPQNPEDALIERGLWNYITQMVLIILGIGIFLNAIRLMKKL